MQNSTHTLDDHVGELLSGYIDGELTQQQQQAVRLHCEQCAQCTQDLADIRSLRERIGQSRLSEVGEDTWRETMNDTTVKTTRGIGWLLVIGAVLAVAGIAVYEFVIDTAMPTHIKLITAAIWVGMGALFVSVLRQRLIERKSDKYKDVEI